MTDDLVKFRMPASFVLARVALRPSELAYGYRHGWLDEPAVVRIAEVMFVDGRSRSRPVDELATLLSEDLWRVPELIDEVECVPEGDVDRVWLYLALDWIREHRGEYAEPFEVIEMLYADFEYPPEMEGLVRFMPAPPGAVSRPGGIDQNWREYLRQRAVEFSERVDRPAGPSPTTPRDGRPR